MIKVVYNNCHGGFNLSEKAIAMLSELGIQFEGEIERHNTDLVKVVETLGDEANSCYSALAIKEIKGTQYIIREYDGLETVVEPQDIQWIEVKSDESFSDAYVTVLDHASEVFEDRGLANRWMSSEVPALGMMKPADVLKTANGFNKVLSVLKKIDEGDFS